jgi:MinD superfamily P-loop ATPase
MRQITVISGKGGTGKTSIVAALASLARPVVLADCDVDAPDLHLLAAPRTEQTHAFGGGRKARVVAEECCACGRCAVVCRFDAIREAPGNSTFDTTYAVDPVACEGCGVCVDACPVEAIRFEPVQNGKWFVSQTRFGPMVHAQLDPGEDNSGKLVTIVREEARRVACDAGLHLILIDGSPGVGCPVIASLMSADMALLVAEPTPSGEHDAVRVIELARQMHVPVALCINRWELNPALASALEARATALGARVCGRVREDRAVVDAQMNQQTIVEHTTGGVVDDARQLWQAIRALLDEVPEGRQPCAS